MVLPEAQAPSRPGSSRQAESLPSLLGPRMPLPWQAAGKLQDMNQHLFIFF